VTLLVPVAKGMTEPEIDHRLNALECELSTLPSASKGYVETYKFTRLGGGIYALKINFEQLERRSRTLEKHTDRSP